VEKCRKVCNNALKQIEAIGHRERHCPGLRFCVRFDSPFGFVGSFQVICLHRRRAVQGFNSSWLGDKHIRFSASGARAVRIVAQAMRSIFTVTIVNRQVDLINKDGRLCLSVVVGNSDQMLPSFLQVNSNTKFRILGVGIVRCCR
jgi:hypothetical protein